LGIPRWRDRPGGLRETGIIATRQLAKRQLTWLRVDDNPAAAMLERQRKIV
jgi:tRNA A37 N6-isopentenylltransferase MiaA